MKKILCLLLLLSLLLCACGAPEPTPDPEAELYAQGVALMEAGNYEEAIRVFSSIPSYQEISARIGESEAQLQAQKEAEEAASVGFLLGTWKDLNSEAVIVFGENNMAVLTENDYQGNPQSHDIHYEKRQGQLYITWFGDAVAVEERSGVTHLVATGYEENVYDFVPEAAYETLGPEFVTITAENWNAYFEILSVPCWSKNDFGEVSGFDWATLLTLREDFSGRIVWDLSPLSFGYTRTMVARGCAVDIAGRTVTLGGVRHRWDQNVEETFSLSGSSYLPDYYLESFPNALYTLHSCRWSESDPDELPFLYEDVTVTRVAGTLAILPE